MVVSVGVGALRTMGAGGCGGVAFWASAAKVAGASRRRMVRWRARIKGLGSKGRRAKSVEGYDADCNGLDAWGEPIHGATA